MAATWIGIGIAAAGLLVSLGAVLVRLNVALALNTRATKDLMHLLEEQKAANACQDDTLANHETRITRIEMVPEVKRGIA